MHDHMSADGRAATSEPVASAGAQLRGGEHGWRIYGRPSRSCVARCAQRVPTPLRRPRTGLAPSEVLRSEGCPQVFWDGVAGHGRCCPPGGAETHGANLDLGCIRRGEELGGKIQDPRQRLAQSRGASPDSYRLMDRGVCPSNLAGSDLVRPRRARRCGFGRDRGTGQYAGTMVKSTSSLSRPMAACQPRRVRADTG